MYTSWKRLVGQLKGEGADNLSARSEVSHRRSSSAATKRLPSCAAADRSKSTMQSGDEEKR